ncbi:MAG: methyl-accepting chemotaxis protein [Desulfamplus sp.]|nr:methyl-accepting chemotaxis protein [Desulfamplus sp.]
MFKKLKLGSKLMLGFSSVATIALILGIIGYYSDVKNGAAIDEIGEVLLPSIQAEMEMQFEIGLIIRHLRTLLIPGLTKDDYERQYDGVAKARTRYQEAAAIYDSLPRPPEEETEWKAFSELIAQWFTINDEILQFHHKTDKMNSETSKVEIAQMEERVQEMTMVDSRPIQNKILERISTIVDMDAVAAKEEVRKTRSESQFLKKVSFGATLSGILLAISLGVIITRSITRPVLQGVNFAQTISQGDMSQQIATDRNDEIGDLIKSLNNMSANLRGMFKEIITGIQTLSSSSIQLNSIAKQMSLGSEQTSGKAHTVAAAAEELSSNINSVAAAMEQTNTNMNLVASAAEEMTSTITEIAGNAEKVQQVTDSAEKEAQAASERVKNLGKAAQEIGKVTQVIAEISSQTNLLALNATIEAARAGEAGKGFAVVASEIKDLAKQTATAAEDIKTRIKGIQDATGSTVDEIIHISGVITQVNEGVSTIAAAVEEQSATTREIADNVSQASMAVSDVGQNVAESSSVTAQIARDISGVNLSASEMASSSTEVSMSAQELSRLAEQLKDMMEKFKV